MAAEVRKNEKYEVRLRKGRLDLKMLSHPIGENSKVVIERCSSQFAERERTSAIVCFQLTPDFLIFGTEDGGLVYHYLDDCAGPCLASEYRHSKGGIIRWDENIAFNRRFFPLPWLWPNSTGTRLLFEDDHHFIYLHNPLNDQAILVSRDAGTVDFALWDTGGSLVFVLSALSEISVYIYSPVNIQGSTVSIVQTSTIPSGLYPVALRDNLLICKNDEAVENIAVPIHSWVQKSAHGTEHFRERFDYHLTVSKFNEALEDAKSLNCPTVWEKLIKKALEQMELEVAMKACQYSRNIKLLISLQNVQYVEEYNLLAGHMFLLLENYDAAQESFLKSTCPEAAVELRRDLEHWDQAMTLARELKSPLQPEILTKYAYCVELAGDYRQALCCYEEYLKLNLDDPNQKYFCQAGVARASIHLGDIWKGKQLAKECKNSILYRECARILEGLNLQKQHCDKESIAMLLNTQDAAELYELDGQLEKAVEIYITIKSHSKALSLLETISSPKFYVLYARALETERKFSEAASAYEAAKTKSLEGASMVSKYCRNTGEYQNAIEFLILQERTQEASELAQQQDMMDVYTEMVADVASKEEYLKLARYYEAIGNSEKAANMFEKCGDPQEALRLYLLWGGSQAIEQAIDMVDKTRDDVLTNQLLGFLKGETEGVNKNPKYLYRLHMALGDYDLATEAALQMAQQEQDTGNYKIAHQQLLDLYKVLQNQQRRAPYQFFKQLILLHSYTLVKTLIRLGDHKSGARMLIRVAQHISNFPAHIIPILISTVIECQRSGLKKTAFEYASMLMRPEYRNQITGPYKRKIENIVRKPEREEEDEELSPCPFCQRLIPETQLECSACRNNLPGIGSFDESAMLDLTYFHVRLRMLRHELTLPCQFCIASGRHMVLGNWTKCPSCQFPGLSTEFIKVIEMEGLCPMCWSEVAVKDIEEVADPIQDMRIRDSSLAQC